jgi:hypothetical protein
MPSGKQLSFQYGEVSPSLRFKSDAVSYASGLSKLKNMYVRRAGGVSNRPGFEFIKLSESQYDIPAEGAPAGIKGFTYWDPLKNNWVTVEYGKFLNPVSGNPQLGFKYTTGNDYSSSYSSIVTGADGALNILSGATVDVAEGSVKHYSSINIAAGGTLRITGGAGAWTEIGCSGNCVIDGTILVQTGNFPPATHSGGTFTKTSAFGLGDLSYTIQQALGGSGSAGVDGAAPGAQLNGNGGGGSGSGDSTLYGQGLAGGNGESSGGNGSGTTGGAGNSTLGNGANAVGSNGGTGGGGGGGAGINTLYGGGGGGGYRGKHGKGLVLYVEGTISGSGSIFASGGNGFSGGRGAVKTILVRGGSGGGGAGGSGGKVIVKYRSGIAPSISTSAGFGGAGGIADPTYGALAGQAGQNGYDGSSTVEALAGLTFTNNEIINPQPEKIKYTVLKESLFITPNVELNTGSGIVPFNPLIKNNSLEDIRPFGYPGAYLAATLSGVGTAVTGAVKVNCSYMVTVITLDNRERYIGEIKGVTATGPWYPNSQIWNKITVTFAIAPTDVKAVRLYLSSGGTEVANYFYQFVGQAPYTSGTSVTISDYGGSDVTQTPPTDDSAFTGYSIRNYNAAAYYQQRLIASTEPKTEGAFISNTLKSGDMVASKLGSPEQLDFPVIYNDTGAFQFSVPITDGTPVIALLAMERLIAFTQRGVYVIRGSDSAGAIITPTQINPFLISEEGCSLTVEPKMSGRRGYFINSNHTKLMAIEFGDDANLTIKEASVFSDHLLLEDICQLEVLGGGEDTVYLLRRDGKMIRITPNEEGAHGFSLIETDGFIESIYRGKAKKLFTKNIASSGTADRYADVLMAYVIRNGKRFLERLTFRDDLNKEGEFFLDCFGVFGLRLCYNGVSGYTRVSVPYPFNGGDLQKDPYNVKINIPDTGSWAANVNTEIWASGTQIYTGSDGVLHFYYEDETGATQKLRFESTDNWTAGASGDVDFPQKFEGFFTSDVPEILQDVASKDLTTAEKNKLLTRWLPAFNVIQGDSLRGVKEALLEDPLSFDPESVPVSVVCEGEVLSSTNNPDRPTLTLDKDAFGETSISLPDYYSYGHFGISYESDFETLDIEASDSRTFTDTRKLLNAVGVAFNETRGGYFGIEDAELSNMAPISPTNYSPFNNQSELDSFNGHMTIPIPTNWSERGRVRIRQVDPLPMTILSVYPKGVAGD